MNKARVVSFAIFLLVLRVIVGAAMGFFEVGGGSASQYVLHSAIDVLVVAGVFVRMGWVQKYSPYSHAIAILILSELLALPLAFSLLGGVHVTPLWPLDYLLLALSMLAGTAIGKRFSRDRAVPNAARE